MTKSQNTLILKHLRNKGGITQIEALRLYGCMRLGARIYELKERGHEITSDMIPVLNRYNKSVKVARYKLSK